MPTLHAVVEDQLFCVQIHHDHRVVIVLIIDNEGEYGPRSEDADLLGLPVQVVREVHEVVRGLLLFLARRERVSQQVLQLEEEQGVEQVEVHRVIRVRRPLRFEKCHIRVYDLKCLSTRQTHLVTYGLDQCQLSESPLAKSVPEAMFQPP